LEDNLNKLNEENLYRNIGLSNFSIGQIELFLSKNLFQNQVIYALQNHYNLIERDSSRLAFDEYSRRTNLGVSSQILPWVVANKKFFFAYHALCRGVLTDRFLAMNGQVANSIHSDRTGKYIQPKVFNLLNLAKDLAIKYQTSVAAIALSWLKQEYPQTIPIVSFNSIFQLKQATKLVHLTDLEFQSLDILTNL
jgi:aryl-alcohol dehydrogenase-like predicted oxidoreductase